MTPPEAARLLLIPFLLICLLIPFSASASQGTIFVYHRFGESNLPSTNISPEIFAAQLEYLRTAQIPVLPLGEVVQKLRSEQELPGCYAVLTVDDGYSSFLGGAMPLLRRYGYPVTLFVNTRSVGARGYLGWEQLRRLQREGVEIGNHSHTHPHLVNLLQERGAEAVKEELYRSQQLFAEKLGVAPRLFAYPFGESVPQIVRLVTEAGFIGAAVQHSGVVAAHSDPYQLPRFAMGGVYATVDGFIEKSRMSALPVSVESPPDALLGDSNPPELLLRLAADATVAVSALNCFVAGQRTCTLRPLPGGEGRFRVVADHPLTGRRTRYTLTAQDAAGRWYWYSWLWIDPSARE